jgi:hypothetical protein
MKVEVSGNACLVLLGLKLQCTDDQPAHAAFGGIIDIRGIGPVRVEVEEIVLDLSP